MNPVTEILLSAAFALTPKENWTQGAFECGDGMCARRAIELAARAHGDGYTLQCAAVNAFCAANGFTPIMFNDRPGRKHSEVLNALYRAAEFAEGQS